MYIEIDCFNVKSIFNTIKSLNVLENRKNFNSEETSYQLLTSLKQKFPNQLNLTNENVLSIKTYIKNEYNSKTSMIFNYSDNDSKLTSIFPYLNPEMKELYFFYFYWKLSLETLYKKQKFNSIQKIGRLFNINKPSEVLKTSLLGISYKCPHCNKVGLLLFSHIKSSSIFEFYCSHCQHHEKTENKKIEINFLNCTCNNCNEKRTKFRNFLKNSFKDLKDRFNKELNEERKKISMYNTPSLIEMERDYKINSSMLSKDIRFILDLKPRNYNDLIDCIEKIINRDHKYNRNITSDDLISKLEENNIIYRQYNSEFFNHNENIFFDFIREVVYIRKSYKSNNGWGFREINEPNKKTEYLNKLEETLINTDNYKDLRNERHLNLSISFYKMFSPPNYEKITFSLPSRAKYKIPVERICILNKFYFDEKITFNNKQSKTNSKNLFNSESEKSLYLNLRNSYTDCIIIPNKKLIEIINYNEINQHFETDEKEYLKKCICDYAIYDLNGNIIKIIELQKGLHHNNPEWILKDSLKKRACLLNGIIFEEFY